MRISLFSGAKNILLPSHLSSLPFLPSASPVSLAPMSFMGVTVLQLVQQPTIPLTINKMMKASQPLPFVCSCSLSSVTATRVVVVFSHLWHCFFTILSVIYLHGDILLCYLSYYFLIILFSISLSPLILRLHNPIFS
ncbi:hypothetical protein OTU49_002092 [Cherax quadricarinatus]|uniref:Uncharacterized protein n=1 Tax=Cherax quadricarinatus TaxID=27406 RepID=A0AAW0XS62_CHEQU